MLMLLVQGPHCGKHCGKTQCGPKGERNFPCTVAVKGSLWRESGTWLGHGRLYRRFPTHSQVIQGKTEHRPYTGLETQGRFRCVSPSVGMDNWGWLCKLAWHERRPAGELGARCKAMLKSLDFILRVPGS